MGALQTAVKRPKTTGQDLPAHFSISPSQTRPVVEPKSIPDHFSAARIGHSFGQLSVTAPAPTVLQKKLAVNVPGDSCEQEADRLAGQALNSSTRLSFNGAPPPAQRFSEAAAAPASVERVLSDSGSSLDTGLRQDMESRFGHDFSRVRVHAGTAAAQSARDVNAQAYTVGQDIVFGAGRFAPGTGDGRRLLAHELTHVVQQTGKALHFVQRQSPSANAPAASSSESTKAESVPVQWNWDEVAGYPLLVDIWNDVVLKKLKPADFELLKLKGTEGAAFYAWTMAVGLAPSAIAGGDKPKDFGATLTLTDQYASTLAGLTPAGDYIFDPLSYLIGLRLDDYLSSDLFVTRLKAHASGVVSLALIAQGISSISQEATERNKDRNTTEADIWTRQTGLVKTLVNKIFKKHLQAPGFFDVGPMQLGTHPAFSAAPFAGSAAPSGLTFDRQVDPSGKLRSQSYGLTLNMPQLVELAKPGGPSASDIADPAKYRDTQASGWFLFNSTDPLPLAPTSKPSTNWKGGTILGNDGHLFLMEAGAQYGGETGKELTSLFTRGGYGYAAGEKDTSAVKAVGFTATYMEWKEAFVPAPRTDSGVAAEGWAAKATPFIRTQFSVGEKKTVDASAAISFVAGKSGDDKTSVGVSDVSLGLAYTYMGDAAPGKLPAFKLDLSGSLSRLDWFDKNSPLLMGTQVKGNVGNAFVGAKVMTGAAGIPQERLEQIGPTVKTMVPTAVLFTGGYSF